MKYNLPKQVYNQPNGNGQSKNGMHVGFKIERLAVLVLIMAMS
tara:strand:- start:10983 stop:11111 length:129 start_codon:yes stop_codon:yes gene_type:complete